MPKPTEAALKQITNPAHIPAIAYAYVEPESNAPNLVKVHTELGKPGDIYIGNPPDDANGSLVTTANDFSKFMSAWIQKLQELGQKEKLKKERELSEEEELETPFKSAFEPPKGKTIPTFNKDDTTAVCGLGWHLCRDDEGKLIAYQYGENTNTRSFVAINVTDKKGAVFFTNCEQGMSIANQIFTSPDLAPIGDTRKLFKENMARHPQSDDPGWKETLAGKILENQAKIDDKEQYKADINKARYCFAKAAILAPRDESKKNRLDWFNEAHPTETDKKIFDNPPLASFEGVYTNQWGDRCEIKVKDDRLVYEKFGVETKLVRVSETEFLPEKDQSMKLEIHGAQMIRKPETGGDTYILYNESLEKSQEAIEIPVEDEVTCSEKNLTQKDAREITQQYKSALKDAKVEAPTSDNKQLNAQNPIEPTMEDDEVRYRPK